VPDPEYFFSWFVLGHESGEVRPSILERFTTIGLTPYIHPCLLPEDANALVARLLDGSKQAD
jgi:hypothetical protein